MSGLRMLAGSLLRPFHELACIHCGTPFAWRNNRRKQCLDCEAERCRQHNLRILRRRNERLKAVRAS